MASSLSRRLLNTRNIRSLKYTVSRSYAEAAGGNLALTFSTPRQVFFNDEIVTQVDVPSGSGNFCILADHVPIIAVLKPGLLSVTKEGNIEKYFVSSGTITVNKDSSAQILAEEGGPLDMFDVGNARKAADDARSALSSASTEEGKAEAQIQLDASEALLNALEGR